MEDDGMDALFSSFMSEVTNIKSAKMKKIEGNQGTPDEIIERVLARPYDPKQGQGSAYQILQVAPDATESEITKQYRRLSVLVHPDKCKLDRAAEAFQAPEACHYPNYQDKYADVIIEAKKRVRKEREKQNEAREKRGEDPLATDGQEFDRAVWEECERMTSAATEHAEQANSVAEANKKRYEEQARERRERKKAEQKEVWKMLRPFQERKDTDGKADLDMEDKKVIRSDMQAAFVDMSYRKDWRDYIVAPRWQGVYPQKDYGGPFEIQVVPVDVGPDQVDWIASRKAPPGSCTYKFVMESDYESICKADPETLTADGLAHYTEFHWDVPIAPEPYPEIDSRPSTASSRDGAQVDPRFEQDWEALLLKWVESFMKVRVKDVLAEFFAILIDLFDSYAFMGLDLSASQHTIGMDDWKHLVINCGLLNGQPEGNLDWQQVCTWFEEAAGVRDGRPYLAQRLTRAHYLELLMRTASWTMCEHPREQYVPEKGRPPMPLDEGLFRFITDILIPVMDIYDDDPIRKDAVQHENLVVIQENRRSIRSIYSFLAQPWPHYQGERVLIPGTLRYVLEYALAKLLEAEEAPPPPPEEGEPTVKAATIDMGAVFGGEERLNIQQLEVILETFDSHVSKITANHPEEAEQRALLFWEFFEVLMESCRSLTLGTDTPLEKAIPAYVQTMLAFMGLVDREEASLPQLAGSEHPEDELLADVDEEAS
eukprot:g1297.t1